MASARDQHACPSPPCHPGAVEARSTAKREVEGVLARECAHVERVIDVGAGPPSSREQRDGHPCRCRHGGQLRRSGRALVAMVEPAHFWQFYDLAHARRLDGSRLGRVFAQRKMGPCPVIVGKVRLQNLQEMALTENDDVIEALSPYGSDKPLDIWILPRGPGCCDDLLYAEALVLRQDVIRDGRFSTVAMVDSRGARTGSFSGQTPGGNERP